MLTLQNVFHFGYFTSCCEFLKFARIFCAPGIASSGWDTKFWKFLFIDLLEKWQYFLQTGDSSDTQSEAESIKSVRLRRKLPNLPQEQRSSPSPTRKTVEKSKNGITDAVEAAEEETSDLTPASAVTLTTTVTTSLETSRQYSPLTALGTPSPQPVTGSLSPLLGRRAELSRTPSPGLSLINITIFFWRRL